MKIYKPLFSLVLIVIELILSLERYYALEEWRKANPELDAVYHPVVPYQAFFIFVLVIGVCEMFTKPGVAKKLIRIFLVSIVVGFYGAGIISIEEVRAAVYYIAWFSAVVAMVLILVRIIIYLWKKIFNRKLNKATR